MRVDFYLLSRDPVETALPRIARAVKGAGQRLLVVSADPAQLAALDQALWQQEPEQFLAHGVAGDRHAARQPLLLADSCVAQNGATYVALADGQWRDEALAFERVFLFFDDSNRPAARQTWTLLRGRDGVERHFWQQDGGRWSEVMPKGG